MKIAKIVSSNSHIDYVARVIDALDCDSPPQSTDYCFGQFVGLSDEMQTVIGIIYDSRLVNTGASVRVSARVRRSEISVLTTSTSRES